MMWILVMPQLLARYGPMKRFQRLQITIEREREQRVGVAPGRQEAYKKSISKTSLINISWTRYDLIILQFILTDLVIYIQFLGNTE